MSQVTLVLFFDEGLLSDDLRPIVFDRVLTVEEVGEVARSFGSGYLEIGGSYRVVADDVDTGWFVEFSNTPGLEADSVVWDDVRGHLTIEVSVVSMHPCPFPMVRHVSR